MSEKLARVSARMGAVATWAATALISGGLCAGIIALRIVELEQPFNPRNLSNLAIFAIGAAIATTPALYLRGLLRQYVSPAPRLAIVAILTLVLTIGASLAAFAVVLRDVIEGNVLHGDRFSLTALMVPHASAAYLMLLSGWALMFPWPLPTFATLLALIAEFLPGKAFASRARSRSPASASATETGLHH